MVRDGVMRVILIIAVAYMSLLLPQSAFSMNRERQLDADSSYGEMRRFESETELQRDLLGRKVIIDPNSQIDAGSLNLEVAPGSTVIIRARQYDKGVQTTKTPYYKNVELPR